MVRIHVVSVAFILANVLFYYLPVIYCYLPFRKPIVSPGRGLQTETSLLAESGIFTERFNEVHCPRQINRTPKQNYHETPAEPDVQRDAFSVPLKVSCQLHHDRASLQTSL